MLFDINGHESNTKRLIAIKKSGEKDDFLLCLSPHITHRRSNAKYYTEVSEDRDMCTC